MDKPGDPLNGFQIEVPPGAYTDTRTFKVSQTPVQNHTFGPNFDPISPLISIDNGGDYSQELMTVKIPAKIPEGYFAMAFFYDDASKKLEGIPLMAEDSDSLTVVTGHFSAIIATKIAVEALIKMKTIDSGFRPGVDNWQFPNKGSYIANRGHCSGQCLSAMWYYCEKTRKGALPLYDLYNNNGDLYNNNGAPNPKTAIWQDDSLGYRLASIVQVDYDKSKWADKFFHYIRVQKWDELTWRAFVYAMSLTGEPQYVGIYNSQVGGGHALIVYKILNLDYMSGILYVDDPNYPDDPDRKIEFANGKFQPYSSGANAQAIQQGLGKKYDCIGYYAKTALVDWRQLTKRWGEFYEKTIGAGLFPAYTLMLVNDKGPRYPLLDGFITGEEMLSVELDMLPPSTIWELSVYQAGGWITPVKWWTKIKLNPGRNLLGFLIKAFPDTGADFEYIDFKWVNVYLQTLVIKPEFSEPGEPNTPLRFYVTFEDESTKLPANVRYEWDRGSAELVNQSENKVTLKWLKEGQFSIAVKVYDAAKNELLGEAQKAVQIKSAAPPPPPPPPVPEIDLSQCKQITFTVDIDIVYVYSPMKEDKLNASFFIQDLIDGEFSGNTFTGSRSVVSKEKNGPSKITFTLDPSLGQLTSFSYFCTDYRDYLGRPMWADLEITGRSLPRVSVDDDYWLSYQVEDEQTCDHLGVKGTYNDRSYSVISEVWCGKDSRVTVVFQKR